MTQTTMNKVNLSSFTIPGKNKTTADPSTVVPSGNLTLPWPWKIIDLNYIPITSMAITIAVLHHHRGSSTNLYIEKEICRIMILSD
jgi:hypothetical protein